MADGAIDSVESLAPLNLGGVPGFPVLPGDETTDPAGRRLGLKGCSDSQAERESNDVQVYLSHQSSNVSKKYLNTFPAGAVLDSEAHR